MSPTVGIRRVLRGGEAWEETAFPPGWEVVRVPGETSRRPLGEAELPPPGSIVPPEGRLVVVVNDAQRPTPTPWLLERLRLDWGREDLRLAVATGSHAPPSEEDLHEIFGPHLETVRPRLWVHRARTDRMLDAGRTSRGTAVEISACLEGARAVVCLGSVEPHYFAGWTGGRKSLVPGLCSLETMRGNHRLAMEEGAAPGALEGNPLHEDLREATARVGSLLSRAGGCELFGLNVVHCGPRLYGWRYGPLPDLAERLAPVGWEVFGRAAPGNFPLVVCFVDHPLDRDLYQALKAFEHWKHAVAPGGVLVVVADCPAGIGPPTFHQFTSGEVEPGEFLRRVAADYRLGDHKLANFLRYVASGRRLWAVAGNLPAQEGLVLPVFPRLSEAIAEASRLLGPGGGRALAVENAAHCIPGLRPDVPNFS